MREQKELLLKIGKIISNNKFLYYFLNYTWGLVLTIVGWVTLGYLLLFKKVYRYNKNNEYFEKRIWVLKKPHQYNFSIGTLVVLSGIKVDQLTNQATIYPRDVYMVEHEIGHTIQNAIFGPFMLFIVSIPSMIRYWWRANHPDRVKTHYEDIWFEGTASMLGSDWRINYRY